jgi:hypothetical protein
VLEVCNDSGNKSGMGNISVEEDGLRAGGVDKAIVSGRLVDDEKRYWKLLNDTSNVESFNLR